MVTGSQAKKMLETQLRELYGRVVWTHKTQEKCADILKTRNHNIKVTQIVLSALTTTGILVTVFGDNKIVGIVSAILSAIGFTINAYYQKYDLGEISEKHADSASDIWSVREKYLSLLTDLKSENADIDEIRAKRDELQEELHSIYKGSPRTISKAYKEATKALKKNEELTFSDNEIDNLLPIDLRKE
ncbi:SLATT domain-containing protein [Sinomicrobium oceani]|uniref:SLATT domain-containing protein n=1 Tax=Sinomicrobium oceani TaxID=1150368 RepID=UPI00227D2126|nr:SLATT domain-containing protein [Sinomicrobium oceani]